MSNEPVNFTERPKHFTLKVIGLVASLGLLVTAITLGAMGYLRYESGYYQLTAAPSTTSVYGGDVKAVLYLEGSSNAVRAQLKDANNVYSKALETIFIRSDPDQSYSSEVSLGRVNANLNAATPLDKETYALLKQAYEQDTLYSNFSLYGAALYDYWATIAQFPSTTQATEDPINNAASATYLASLVDHVKNADAHCSLVFDEAATSVKLSVDETYLSFRKDNSIASPIVSLNCLRPAYETDFVSKALIQAGYTKGFVATTDGVMMTLGAVDSTEYRLYDHDGSKSIYYGTIQSSGETCCVESRRFENDASRAASPYYLVKDASGTLHYRSPWISLVDGYPSDYLVEMALRKKDLDVVSAALAMNELASANDEAALTNLKTTYLHSGDLLSYNKKGETKKVYVNAAESASLVLISAEGYEKITY
jgi:hypothetical protein